MHMVSARLLLLIVALPVSFPAMAEIYKWVDDQGRVNYSDRSDGGSSSLQVEVDDSPSTSPAIDSLSREEKRRRLLETMQEDRYEKENRRAKEKAERKRDHRMCIQYKDRMRLYEQVGRLYKLDNDGNRNYMSNEERDGSVRDLQARINKYCH